MLSGSIKARFWARHWAVTGARAGHHPVVSALSVQHELSVQGPECGWSELKVQGEQELAVLWSPQACAWHGCGTQHVRCGQWP